MNETWSPGVYQLLPSGLSPYLGQGLTQNEGQYSIDFFKPVVPNQLQMWAVYAFENVSLHQDVSYRLFAGGPPEPSGEGNESPNNACGAIGDFNHDAVQYFVNRTLGLQASTGNGQMQSASGTAQDLRLYLLDAGGSGSLVGSREMPAGTWHGVYGRISQVHPASMHENDYMFANLTIEGEHALIALPSTPWICKWTFNAANEGATFVQNPLAEWQQGGTGSWYSHYGSFAAACGEENPTQLWLPRALNEATLNLGGFEETIGEDDVFFHETTAPAEFFVQVTEWWGYPRFTYAGVPHDFLIGSHDCE